MDGGAHQYLLILQSHQWPSKSIHVTQCDTRLRHILLLKHFIGAACSTDSGPESRHPPSGQKVKWAQPSTPALRVLHGAMSESPLRAMLVTCSHIQHAFNIFQPKCNEVWQSAGPSVNLEIHLCSIISFRFNSVQCISIHVSKHD